MNLNQHAKMSLFHLCEYGDGTGHIGQPLTFVNLYHEAKKFRVFLVCSGDIINLKILQSNCLIGFEPLSQKPDFPQI